MANIKIVGVDITSGQEKTVVGGDTIRPETGDLTITGGGGAVCGNVTIYGNAATSGGAGGIIGLEGGDVSGGAGTGGIVYLIGGQGGNSGTAGNVEITGGFGGVVSGSGGTVLVTGGASPVLGSGGSITITGGTPFEGAGGSVSLTSANGISQVSGNASAGNINISAGSSRGSGLAGDITLLAGAAGSNSNGGSIALTAGLGGLNNFAIGGDITMTSGRSVSVGAAGGAISLTTGISNTSPPSAASGKISLGTGVGTVNDADPALIVTGDTELLTGSSTGGITGNILINTGISGDGGEGTGYGTGNINIQSGICGAGLSGNIAIQTGDSGGDSGSIVIDVGTAVGTTGTINIGNNASSITIQGDIYTVQPPINASPPTTSHVVRAAGSYSTGTGTIYMPELLWDPDVGLVTGHTIELIGDGISNTICGRNATAKIRQVLLTNAANGTTYDLSTVPLSVGAVFVSNGLEGGGAAAVDLGLIRPGLVTPGVDLSTLKNVTIRIDALSPHVDIDLSAGAAIPSAATQAEIMANLTTALGAEATVSAADSGTGQLYIMIASATTGTTSKVEFQAPSSDDATLRVFGVNPVHTTTGLGEPSPGTVTIQVIRNSTGRPSAGFDITFITVTDDGAGAIPGSAASTEVLSAAGTINYTDGTMTGVTHELEAGSDVVAYYVLADTAGENLNPRGGNGTGAGVGGDLNLNGGAGGNTTGNSGSVYMWSESPPAGTGVVGNLWIGADPNNAGIQIGNSNDTFIALRGGIYVEGQVIDASAPVTEIYGPGSGGSFPAGSLILQGGWGNAGQPAAGASLTGGTADGTDQSGNDVTIGAGPGTGDGLQGNIRIQTTDLGTTSTTVQLPIDRVYIRGTRTDLTNNTPVNLFEVAITAGQMAGGYATYNIRSSDGTDHQARSGTVYFSGVNKAGTVTTSATAGTTDVSVSAGTLAQTWASTAGTNKFTISLNADSSLTPTLLDVMFTVHMEATQALTLL